MNTPSTSVSPGLGGFIAFFVLAIALWLLMRNMNARLRRMRYREEDEARQAEQLAQPQPPAAGAEDSPSGSAESAESAESDEPAEAAESGGPARDERRGPGAAAQRPGLVRGADQSPGRRTTDG